MSDARITRCPHCKATFEVTDEQLSAAAGKVRCGACMNVFDAIAYLLTNEPKEPVESEPQQQKPQKPSSDTPAEPSSEDDFVFEDSEEEKAQANKRRLFDEAQLSDSFLDLDKTDTQDAFASEARHTDEYVEKSVESEDEDWAERILEDDNDAPRANKNEEIPKPKTQTEPSSSTTVHDPVDFYYEEQPQMHGRSALAKFGIGIGSFILILVLLAQAAWFHYEKLAQYPIAKQSFEFACQHLGCSLPKLVDLNKIRSHNLVVRSHPQLANALIIDVVLTNEADFAQDYPRLALYFSDINGKTIAQKIISPHEYLSSEFSNNQPMPSHKDIHVSLELEDPGKNAVNYKIRFFPSKGGEAEQ